MENRLFSLQAMENDLTAEAVGRTNNLILAKNLIEIEKKSVALAKQNSDIFIEKYRVGLFSNLELRDAQIRYLNAEIPLPVCAYSSQIGRICYSSTNREPANTLVVV